MTYRLPRASTLHSIELFLGESFKLKNLHNWNVRFRRRYVQQSLALPNVLKLTTASGVVYKLYTGDFKRRFVHMTLRTSQAEETGLFSKVIWEADDALLVEYVSGSKPVFRSEAFARDFGKALASLHKIDNKNINLEHLWSGVKRDLRLLSGSRVLNGRAGQYLADLRNAVPKQGLILSLDYTDVKPANFIFDSAKSLRFIDMGALRANRPAGQYLCGSLHLRQLNRQVFADAYLQSGGLSQVITQAKCLRMLNCIWLAALYVRKMQEVPVFLPVHKLAYWAMSVYLMTEFRRLSRREQTDFRFI